MSTDKDLRERFERWWSTQHVPDIATPDYIAFKAYKAAHAEAQAEIEALRKDAERYRWARKHARFSNDLDGAIVIDLNLVSAECPENVDTAIDVEMASEVKP